MCWDVCVCVVLDRKGLNFACIMMTKQLSMSCLYCIGFYELNLYVLSVCVGLLLLNML